MAQDTANDCLDRRSELPINKLLSKIKHKINAIYYLETSLYNTEI